MWLPLFLKSLNEAEMQSLGMKISAEHIYSVNNGSLKDAIVHFGGFCTSEIISDQGLLLTNHHCGYGQIQSHTTLENNYLKDENLLRLLKVAPWKGHQPRTLNSVFRQLKRRNIFRYNSIIAREVVENFHPDVIMVWQFADIGISLVQGLQEYGRH